jgi:hypothetical protein
MRNRLPLVLSATALVVSLLGATPLGRAAYSAVLPRSSVGTLQLKRNAVTASKIAPNAIRTGQVVNGSLLTADFKPGQIPQGPKGDKGDKGDKGNDGDPGVSGYELATQTLTPNTNVRIVDVSCPGGKHVFGGGVSSQSWSTSSGPYVNASGPMSNGTGWEVTIATFDLSSMTSPITVYAICGTVSS